MSKKALIVGGNGSLGKFVVNKFVNCPKKEWSTISLDIFENKNSHHNILLEKNFSEDKNLLSTLDKKFSNLKIGKVDSVICVAGGFDFAGLKSENLIFSLNFLCHVNLYSSVLSAQLANKYLNDSSLFALTSAAAIHNKVDTTAVLSYQLAKQGVENLFSTLENNKDLLPNNTKLIKICPGVIDTESNRKNMPDEDKSNWTDPDKIATLLKNWSDNLNNAPKENYCLV